MSEAVKIDWEAEWHELREQMECKEAKHREEVDALKCRIAELEKEFATDTNVGHNDQDLMIVESLPSLYPMMQSFEEEAVYRVVERAKYNNGWIACSEKLPEVETKVLIHAKRKYRDGSFRDIITTAMYEDGTMLEDDSKWSWEDIEGEWDEENDCYIIPKGWWEDKMYNADGELNHAVDDEVIAWQPLPNPYIPKQEEQKG